MTYYKVLQLYWFLCKASSPSQDVRFQNKEGPHSYMLSVHWETKTVIIQQNGMTANRDVNSKNHPLMVIILALFS